MNYPNIKSGTRRSRSATFTLRLTSMIDMMTILLVFLLKSYDAEGQIVTITDDLRLPESTSQLLPRVTSVISITSNWILIDGRPVETLQTIKADEQLLIPSLRQELSNLRQITEGIGEMSESMDGFQGNISIQSDRDITFDLLKRILITCADVGYNNMLLTVMQKE
ncbi:biopolymer transporter ExbD [candidate division KSB1 bacterium]|nr:biopolymer transporter ExbD [candidate division KSB1 bacterium]